MKVIYLPSAGTLGCVVWPGAGIAGSQGNPPDFYPSQVNVGLLVPVLPLPLPVHPTLHLCVSPPCLRFSTPPTHLDESGFFKSLVVGLPYSSIF